MGKRTIQKVAGVYYLHNVIETASGVKLDIDGSFRFFFTYGSLDRYGSGKWELDNDKVILNSHPWPGRDFSFVNSGNIDENSVLLRLVGANPLLMKNVLFSLQNGATGSWLQTNDRGEARFPRQDITTISIVFEFCPERFTHFTIENPTHNYFEFRFEEWLMEVFFSNFTLKAESYALSGKHPLLRGEKYFYEKA
jgi:hypothetical protein